MSEAAPKFQSIIDSDAFRRLRSIDSVPNYKTLSWNSIFDASKEELDNVKKDIINSYAVVQKDVADETKQMELLEQHLKNSVKKVNYIYSSTLKTRKHNRGYEHSSKILDKLIHGVDALERNMETLTKNMDDIVECLVKTDSKLPTRSQLLSIDSLNQRHYPLLFDMIKRKYPDNFVKKSTKKLVKGAQLDKESKSEIPIVSGPEFPLTLASEDEVRGQQENQNSHSPFTKAKCSSNELKRLNFVLPSFRRTSSPSIFANSENVNATEIIAMNKMSIDELRRAKT